jgi:hypothetical protein
VGSPVHGEFLNPRKKGGAAWQSCEMPTSCYRPCR